MFSIQKYGKVVSEKSAEEDKIVLVFLAVVVSESLRSQDRWKTSLVVQLAGVFKVQRVPVEIRSGVC